MHKYVKPVFPGNPHKHNGYGVVEYTDPRAHAVLAFLAMILYAKKPHYITVRLAITVLGALFDERKVDWASSYTISSRNW